MDSGLFTITELQKNDSGIYKIDSKKGRVFVGSYNLTVYDPAPTPAVETQTVSSDSCWLICSVDKQASLLWIKDQDILNQSRSALSLPVTVRKEDRNSSYRCVAANPAENKTLHVNVTTSCALSRAGSGDNHRDYWPLITGVTIVLVAIAALVVWVIRQRLLEKKTMIRQTQGSERECHYEEFQIINEPHQEETSPASTESSDRSNQTVYAKLKHPVETSSEPGGPL
ncbi:uncharacterized protein FYW61_005930 [Anableps anableps]